MHHKLTHLLITFSITSIMPVICCGQPTNHQATHPTELFKVTRDSIQVNVEGELYRALLIGNKYYAFYHVRDSMSSAPIRKFYIMAKSGQIEKEIKLPKGIVEDTYPRLYYWHSQIVVRTEFHKNTYFLNNRRGQFQQIPDVVNIPLFEDRNSEITSECRGEFGSTIYFKNKSTGTIYSNHAGCPVVVNKLDDKYFINVSNMPASDIVEIRDPIVTNTTAIPVSKTIFSYDDFNEHFYIPTSFLSKGVLYHIFNYSHNDLGFDDKKERITITKDSVKIGTIQNGKFSPIYTFKDKFDIQLEQHLSTEYQICTFHTEQRSMIGFKADKPPYMEGKYGVIEIDGDEIKIHYFISKRQ